MGRGMRGGGHCIAASGGGTVGAASRSNKEKQGARVGSAALRCCCNITEVLGGKSLTRTGIEPVTV